MRIRSITPLLVRLPLKQAIKMAGIEISHAENLLVRMTDDRGTVGWGEAASAPTMTGDLPAGMVAVVQYLRAAIEGTEVNDPVQLDAHLDELIHGNRAAKSAINMALFDLLGRREKRTVADLLGGAVRRDTPALWILGGTGDELAEARARADEGFVAFKVKVGVAGPGGRVVRDLDRCAQVRSSVGKDARVSADANQGYSRSEALKFAAGAKAAGLDFLEQPVHGTDLAAMQAITAASTVPVGADEGIHSVADLVRHHELGAANGASLKVLKLGSLGRVLQAGQSANLMGLHVNLAGKIAELSIASAAIAQLSAALPQIDWDASVTNQYLAADVARNPVRIVHGRLSASKEPGLGIEVDEGLLEQFVVK